MKTFLDIKAFQKKHISVFRIYSICIIPDSTSNESREEITRVSGNFSFQHPLRSNTSSALVDKRCTTQNTIYTFQGTFSVRLEMLYHYSRTQTLHKGRYKYGQYITIPDPEYAEFLINWITSGGFIAYEDERFCLKQAQGRPRNILYSFSLPGVQQTMVMKVSHISPRYRLSRKIDLFITGLYKDYCKISFHGAMALHKQNFPVTKPLAFWTFKQGFFRKKSYFLCNKLPGSQSIKQLLESCQQNNSHLDFHEMARELASLVRSMHIAGLRHGDLHTGNFLAHTTEPLGSQAKKLPKFTFFLVDYDKCSEVKIKHSWVKTVYDLKDLSSLVIPNVRDEELLEMYFNETPSPYSIRIFRFWKNGGINLRQRLLGLPPKKENRHLAN